MAVAGSVSELNIHWLWQEFIKRCEEVRHRILGKIYEIHIEKEIKPRQHFRMIGLEVRQVKEVPSGMFAKALPACKFAVFTHHFRDGSYGKAYQVIEKWLGIRNTPQHIRSTFNATMTVSKVLKIRNRDSRYIYLSSRNKRARTSINYFSLRFTTVRDDD